MKVLQILQVHTSTKEHEGCVAPDFQQGISSILFLHFFHVYFCFLKQFNLFLFFYNLLLLVFVFGLVFSFEMSPVG